MSNYRHAYLALGQSMDAVSAGIKARLDIFRPCSLLRVRAIQETVHTQGLAELDVRLRFVGLLGVPIKLHSLRQVSSV